MDNRLLIYEREYYVLKNATMPSDDSSGLRLCVNSCHYLPFLSCQSSKTMRYNGKDVEIGTGRPFHHKLFSLSES